MPSIDQLIQMLQGSQRPALPQPRRQLPLGRDGMQGSANDPVDAFNYESAFGDELQQRLADTPQSDSYNYNRLATMLGTNQRSLAKNPITAQGAQVEGQRADLRSAVDEGFGSADMDLARTDPTHFGNANGALSGVSPVVARNIYKRQIGEEQMRQPMEMERIKEAGANERQARQIAATQTMVETQMEPANTTANAYRDNMDRYGAGDNGTGPAVKSINRNGITFQSRPASPAQTPLIRDVGNARYNVPKGTDPWDDPNFVQAAHAVISQSHMSPESQAALVEILHDPERRNLPISEMFDFDPNDAQSRVDFQEAQRLIILLQGQM